jgi:hypothetical protein
MAAQGAQSARRKQQTRRVQAQKSRAPEAKILRIGIIHSGRIVEERLIPSGQSVSVGESPKCTVVIPPGAVPSKRFELFAAKGGRYELHFTTQMHGKVAVQDQVVTLAALSQKGQAKKVQHQDMKPASDALAKVAQAFAGMAHDQQALAQGEGVLAHRN